ncbi:MAG: Lrp/AsnC ligand binding domain-containing protein [Theionarchaea archaeon]|nr:Lrp/AsnC ligand binding domain-containing protein [Theionarchaea archaeon]
MTFVSKCFDDVHVILGIKVEPGTEDPILKELRKSKKVAAVFTSLGDFDIIALLNIEDSSEVTEFVIDRVRTMKGVLDTKTTFIKK